MPGRLARLCLGPARAAAPPPPRGKPPRSITPDQAVAAAGHKLLAAFDELYNQGARSVETIESQTAPRVHRANLDFTASVTGLIREADLTS